MAPHKTIKFVPTEVDFIAGGVVIVPPAVFMEIRMLDAAKTFALETIIDPPPVHTKVPFLAAGKITVAPSERSPLAVVNKVLDPETVVPVAEY